MFIWCSETTQKRNIRIYQAMMRITIWDIIVLCLTDQDRAPTMIDSALCIRKFGARHWKFMVLFAALATHRLLHHDKGVGDDKAQVALDGESGALLIAIFFCYPCWRCHRRRRRCSLGDAHCHRLKFSIHGDSFQLNDIAKSLKVWLFLIRGLEPSNRDTYGGK